MLRGSSHLSLIAENHCASKQLVSYGPHSHTRIVPSVITPRGRGSRTAVLCLCEIAGGSSSQEFLQGGADFRPPRPAFLESWRPPAQRPALSLRHHPELLQSRPVPNGPSRKNRRRSNGREWNHPPLHRMLSNVGCSATERAELRRPW